jgi:hypothetical protein
MKYFLSTITIAFIIVSCTSGKTRYFPDAKGLNNPVEVTIIRNRSYCAAYSTAILLDEIPIAIVRQGQHVTFSVEAGLHHLRADTGVYGNFEKGNKYYFLISPNFFDSLRTCSFEIEKIGEEEGLERVKNSKQLKGTYEEFGKDTKQSTKASVQPVEEQKVTPTPETAPPADATDHSTGALKVAAIPKKEGSIVRGSLREKPKMISNEEHINGMLIKYGFFDASRNGLGDFENHFVYNNDGTITDNATGLMWQENGSTNSLNYGSAKRYVRELNRGLFAGHSDWRMPTVEELASLLKKDKTRSVHIARVFDNKQITCWTVDTNETNHGGTLSGAWIIDFRQGEILQAMWSFGLSAQAIHDTKTTNYVKAVRSIK